MRRRTSLSASGVPITRTLSRASSALRAARDEEVVAAPDGDDQRNSCGRCRSAMRPMNGESGSSRYSTRRMAPSANDSASSAPGARMTRSISSASCASGQITRSMPKPASPLRFLAGTQEVLARHEADRPRPGQLPRHAAADDVDFVEAGAGDEHVGLLRAGAFEDVAAGAGAEHELDVERLEPIGDLGLVIDDEDFVLRRRDPGRAQTRFRRRRR